jgi:TolB-like protein
MDEVGGRAFCFESFTLDLRRGCLRREDREVELRPKSFEVLRYLVENAGRLVPKDELIRAVWPNVVVTDESLTRCVSDVRLALEDDDQRIIKTVTRRGYLFTAPILQEVTSAEAAWPASKPSAPGAPRLSIVVLPFANLSGDTEQEYFVDGITESLATDLSRIPGGFVIAANTAFTYKGKLVDVRQVGRELGVRYVLEGSVQRCGSRMRVNVQLIDAENGMHLWAERFDKPLADLFDMQDEITVRLARMVEVELWVAEGRNAERERTQNMDAVDLAMRGWAVHHQRLTLDSVRKARKLFEDALRLDDANVRALLGLVETLTAEVDLDPDSDRAELIRVAEAAISRAEALAPGYAWVHHYRGRMRYVLQAPAQALREFELAVDVDRNQPWNHAWIGRMKTLLGRAEETEADVAEAMRLSPRDPLLYSWYMFLGIADLCLGQLDRAADHLRKATELNPQHANCAYYLAAALALAGCDAEAAAACAAGRHLAPSFSVCKFRANARSNNPVFLAQREDIIMGMRKAGVPDG